MWRNVNQRRGSGPSQIARASIALVCGLVFLASNDEFIHADSTPVLSGKAAPLPVIRYVNRAINVPGDGTSWSAAFRTIQEGIDAVTVTGLGEVWVVQGLYDEARTSTPHGDGVNTGSVMMKPGVHLYGGFTGTETSLTQRDWNQYPTVISGGKTRDGLDAYHVIVGAEPATLDGFIVTGGNASGANDEGGGGGMFNSGVSPVIRNCIFRGNRAASSAGMSNGNGASPAIIGCTFNSNVATDNAGGMGNWGASTVELRDCWFIANGASKMGGGLLEGDAATSTIVNCVFKDNTVGNLGAGIAYYSNGLSKIINCVFVHNSVTGAAFGGGGVGSWQSSPSLMNCSFTLNTGAGAGVYTNTDNVKVTNCILWNDTGGEVKGSPTITYSDVQGGRTGPGNINADPLFTDPAKADLRLQWGSPCIDAGTSEGAPTTDFSGVTRLGEQGVDMGAYEAPMAALRGYVNDANTGAGLGCAAVVVSTVGSAAKRVVSADLNGRYCAAGLSPGAYLVKAYAPGHASQTKSITLAAGAQGWTFSLAPSTRSGAVYGLCVDRDRGQPLAGIQVDAYIGGVLKGTTFTGACGRYEINHLVMLTAKGSTKVTVEFSSDGYDSEQSDVDVPSGGSTESNTTLTPKFAVPGSIAGVVTNSQTGQPLANARVSTEGVAYISADTDALGVYALTVLPEGTYTVIASAIGYQGKSSAQAVASATETVDFALTPSGSAPAEDINGDAVVNAVDVQLVINAALGIATGLDCDVDCDNSINAVDVQKVINCALGL